MIVTVSPNGGSFADGSQKEQRIQLQDGVALSLPAVIPPAGTEFSYWIAQLEGKSEPISIMASPDGVFRLEVSGEHLQEWRSAALYACYCQIAVPSVSPAQPEPAERYTVTYLIPKAFLTDFPTLQTSEPVTAEKGTSVVLPQPQQLADAPGAGWTDGENFYSLGSQYHPTASVTLALSFFQN